MGPSDNNAPGACCETGNVDTLDGHKVCLPPNVLYTKVRYYFKSDDAKHYIMCVGNNSLNIEGGAPGYPRGTRFNCDNGRFVLVSIENQHYNAVTDTPGHTITNSNTPRMVYYPTGDEAHATPTDNIMVYTIRGISNIVIF